MFGSTFLKGKFVTHFSFCHSFLAFYGIGPIGSYIENRNGDRCGDSMDCLLNAKLAGLQGLTTVQQQLFTLNILPILIIIISRNIPNIRAILLTKNFHSTFRPRF